MGSCDVSGVSWILLGGSWGALGGARGSLGSLLGSPMGFWRTSGMPLGDYVRPLGIFVGVLAYPGVSWRIRPRNLAYLRISRNPRIPWLAWYVIANSGGVPRFLKKPVECFGIQPHPSNRASRSMHSQVQRYGGGFPCWADVAVSSVTRISKEIPC